MFRSAASKVMWVGRATVFLVGLAVILALLFGVASTAFAHKGNKGFFHLGHKNVTSKVSKLIKRGAGPALDLRVGSGPPMKVNSSEKVANLNADKLDGKDATQIGVNGVQRHTSFGTFNSVSPKTKSVSCTPGKMVVGTGFDIRAGTSGSSPNAEADVVINKITSSFTTVTVTAYEDEPTSANWSVDAHAICATDPF